MNRLRVYLFVLLLSGIHCVMAHNMRGPISIASFKLEQVSQHIHVIHGPDGMPNADNHGFINNPAAIVTAHGVIVVDPGSSDEIGQQLLQKIHALTPNPVIAVLNTHVHGDHWLGNHAIRMTYPNVPIYAHQRMIERVNTGEGEDWLKLFMGMTNGAVKGTKVVGPNIGLKGGETLTLDGITLRFHHFGHAHTDHDLMIEVIEDSAVLCGDVVVVNHIPNSDVPGDASFNGTIKAIHKLLELPVTTFVPGHGRSGGRDVPQTALKFLEQLYGLAKHYYTQGLTDYQMKDRIVRDMDQYRNWVNFNEMGRVISYVYLEIERDSFDEEKK